MSVCIPLDCGYQNYDWGKTASESFVARMKGLSNDQSGKNFAELWVGTHPNCPTRLQDSEKRLLSDFLMDPKQKELFFSPAHQSVEAFRDTVPYLLKILSIRTALSIQAHPCKKLAEKLYAENPSKYKDPNHKPELIIALTAFEALCCFRSLSNIMQHVNASPALRELIRASNVLPAANSALPAEESAEEKKILKTLMENLYSCNDEANKAALRQHILHLDSTSNKSVEDRLFLRVHEQYPGDVGCWMVYFLNYVQLAPGQALFLSDSEPHAYISGDGVEIMACSDNVVRAGLTPKWKDVPTLINMLKYDTTGLSRARYERKTDTNTDGWEVQYYQPPCEFPDFSIYRFQFDDNTSGASAKAQLPTIGLGFCLSGSCKVNGTLIKQGGCFAVPFGTVNLESTGEPCLTFISSTNTISSKI